MDGERRRRDLGSLTVDVDACSPNLSVEILERELQLPIEIARSLGALEDSAKSVGQFSDDFYFALDRLAEDPKTDPLSVPFDFEKGVYTLELAPSAVLSLRVFAGDDYEAFAKGDLLDTYAFTPEAYFIGASVDLGEYDATISFEDVGPLVELVGEGPNPESPVTISIFDFTEMGRQDLEARVAVEATTPGDIFVRYELASRRRTVTEGPLAPIDIVTFTAEQDGRTATVADANLFYEPAQSSSGIETLYGTLELDVRGGPLDEYRVTILYDGLEPDVVVQCRP